MPKKLMPEAPYSALALFGEDETVEATGDATVDVDVLLLPGESYSALAQFPETLVPPADPTERIPARWPWWVNPFASLALFAILSYQTCIPKRFKRRCIYEPSCSRYCQQAIQRYGLTRGLMYFWQRWRRCNGTRYQGGHDPP
jgi:putative component of membrane protein insertase Oxa1/YidC/SpoIIIJ protein YidD